MNIRLVQVALYSTRGYLGVCQSTPPSLEPAPQLGRGQSMRELVILLASLVWSNFALIL